MVSAQSRDLQGAPVALMIITSPDILRCLQGSNSKIDGSFVATLLETAAVGVLYLAWKSITEGKH